MAHFMSPCFTSLRNVRKSEVTSVPGTTEFDTMCKTPFLNRVPTVTKLLVVPIDHSSISTFWVPILVT